MLLTPHNRDCFAILPAHVLEYLLEHYVHWEYVLVFGMTCRRYRDAVRACGVVARVNLDYAVYHGRIVSNVLAPALVQLKHDQWVRRVSQWMDKVDQCSMCRELEIDIGILDGNDGFREWSNVRKLGKDAVDRIVKMLCAFVENRGKNRVSALRVECPIRRMSAADLNAFRNALSGIVRLDMFSLDLTDVVDETLVAIGNFVYTMFNGTKVDLSLDSGRMYPRNGTTHLVDFVMQTVLQKPGLQELSVSGRLFNNMLFHSACHHLKVLDMTLAMENVVYVQRLAHSISTELKGLETLVCGFTICDEAFTLHSDANVVPRNVFYGDVCRIWIECCSVMLNLKHIAIRCTLVPKVDGDIVKYIAQMVREMPVGVEILDFAMGNYHRGFRSFEDIHKLSSALNFYDIEILPSIFWNHGVQRNVVCGQHMSNLLLGSPTNHFSIPFLRVRDVNVGLHLLSSEFIEVTNVSKTLCDAALTNVENNMGLPRIVRLYMHAEEGYVDVFEKLWGSFAMWFEAIGSEVRQTVRIEIYKHLKSTRAFVLGKRDCDYLISIAESVKKYQQNVRLDLYDGTEFETTDMNERVRMSCDIRRIVNMEIS